LHKSFIFFSIYLYLIDDFPMHSYAWMATLSNPSSWKTFDPIHCKQIFSLCYIVNSKEIWHIIIYLCDQTLPNHNYDWVMIIKNIPSITIAISYEFSSLLLLNQTTYINTCISILLHLLRDISSTYLKNYKPLPTLERYCRCIVKHCYCIPLNS
jgi:hypothetical protein